MTTLNENIYQLSVIVISYRKPSRAKTEIENTQTRKAKKPVREAVACRKNPREQRHGAVVPTSI